MKLRRIIALLLSFIFVFSFNVATFAADDEVTFVPSEYKEELTLLSSLGLVDMDMFATESSLYVTRGEFSKIATKLLALKVADEITVSPFADVDKEHPYAPYIQVMKQSGFMGGVGDNNFAPDEPVYFEQAVTVFVKIAGYNELALAKGGYPSGYMAVAVSNNLLEGAKNGQGSPLTKGDLIAILENTAFCDMMLPSSYGTSTSYSVYEGRNILTEYHKIFQGEGIVKADSLYTMKTQRTLSGEVVIDSTTYKKASDDILANAVGRKVDFFYKEESGNKTVIFAKKSSDIKEVTFAVNSDLSFDFMAGVYTYETYEKTLKFKIGNDYSVMYNMGKLSPVTEEKMLPSTGNVTLIDNDNDNIYEIIIVNEFYNFITKKYNPNQDILVDRFDDTMVIDFSEYENVIITNGVGVPFEKEKIEDFDIIEVYESDDATTAILIHARLNTTNKIEALEPGKVHFGGKEYVISSDSRSDVAELMLGVDYKFYLNSKNEVVYWSKGSEYKPGYVLKVDSKTSGFNSDVQVTLMTPSGSLVYLELADKVTNITPSGSSYLKKDLYATIFPETNRRELISYKLNDDGDISGVVHALSVNDRETLYNLPAYPLIRLDYFNENWSALTGGETTFYNDNGFNYQFVHSTGKGVMIVPPVTDAYNDDFISVANFESLFSSGTTVPTVSGTYTGGVNQIVHYLTSDSFPNISLSVFHQAATGLNTKADTNDLVITSIRKIYNKETMENEVVLEGMQKGSAKSYTLKNDTLLKRESFASVQYGGSLPTLPETKREIKAGDIVRLILNAKEEIMGLALLFDGESKTITNVGDNSNRGVKVAEVERIRGNFVEAKDESGYTYVFNLEGKPVCVFDGDRTPITKGTTNDIDVGDTIRVLRWTSVTHSFVVYKN